MKKVLLALLLIVFVSTTSFSQELTWHTDMNKASEIAMKEKKPVLMFFTGSDWCGWCKKLQKEVFQTQDFEVWAKDNVVLMELDFPRRTPQEQSVKVQNYQLQKIFKVRGYPTVFFVNPEKKPDGKMNLNSLGKTGFVRGGAQQWLSVANNIIKK
ncbi:thioredoxin family protein [Snuella sedimenti]|uniref:Thioredoxin family protein n=1 Tax=Snuella sedimenti TaxID=2798802 RepID=A0A8J7J8X0_9FLAO|nr:thioredoxin family protein [Snuella sedimenti]MBJ6366484.1 thioredoxin family protein [Snuella sedimenti]